MFHDRFQLLILTLAVFLGSYLGTALMRVLAVKNGYVARPRLDRWHQRPTALLGGVGFYPPFLVGVWWVLKDTIQPSLPTLANLELMKLPVALVAGSMLMAGFGLLDDLR